LRKFISFQWFTAYIGAQILHDKWVLAKLFFLNELDGMISAAGLFFDLYIQYSGWGTTMPT
jgi:hypothetical protein